ncbi:MAG: SMP-30/gluconolactonase/LRE family protein [Sciscionella sp.]
MSTAERITEICTFHGEGPFWDDRGDDRLLFVDMLAGDVMELDAQGEVLRHPVADVAAVVRAREQGGYVMGIDRGFAFVAQDFSRVDRLPAAFADPAVRMNEGGCDPQGRFYCGSMDYDQAAGRGSLYCLKPDGSVRVVVENVTVSNGLRWSADGATAYYVDTPLGRIDAFDFDGATGAFSNRRPFAQIAPGPGGPDGLAIDSEGGLWVAIWGGSAVHRYGPSGALDAVVQVDAPHVTACSFGGADLDTLYITTSRDGVDDSDTTSGSLFSFRPGVSGLPEPAYAG